MELSTEQDRLAGRYDNLMPSWFLAPIAGLKLPTRDGIVPPNRWNADGRLLSGGADNSSWDNRTIEQAEGKSATVEKTATFSRDTSNSCRNSQLEHQATAADPIGTSQTSTAEGRPATARMPELVETSQQQY
jgi:hypothetical protein